MKKHISLLTASFLTLSFGALSAETGYGSEQYEELMNEMKARRERKLHNDFEHEFKKEGKSGQVKDKEKPQKALRQRFLDEIQAGIELADADTPKKLSYNRKDIEERERFFREEACVEQYKYLDIIDNKIKVFEAEKEEILNGHQSNLPTMRLRVQQAEMIENALKKPSLSSEDEVLIAKISDAHPLPSIDKRDDFAIALAELKVRAQQRATYLDGRLQLLKGFLNDLHDAKKNLKGELDQKRDRWNQFTAYLKLLGVTQSPSELSTREKKLYYKMFLDPTCSLMTLEKAHAFIRRQGLKDAFGTQTSLETSEAEEDIEEWWNGSKQNTTSIVSDVTSAEVQQQEQKEDVTSFWTRITSLFWSNNSPKTIENQPLSEVKMPSEPMTEQKNYGNPSVLESFLAEENDNTVVEGVAKFVLTDSYWGGDNPQQTLIENEGVDDLSISPPEESLSSSSAKWSVEEQLKKIDEETKVAEAAKAADDLLTKALTPPKKGWFTW